MFSDRPLDAKHRFWRMLLEDKIRPSPKPPPPDHPENILDVGCGLGSLCLDMAYEHPGSRVVGIDLKPVSIDPASVPINCIFITGNIFTTDAFTPGQFDLIISRDVRSDIPTADWGHYLCRLFQLLKPGGWVHFVEMDPWPCTEDAGGSSANSGWLQYTEAMQAMMNAQGLQYYGLIHDLEVSIQALQPASFVSKTLLASVGKWTKGTKSSAFTILKRGAR
jgi:2-polyprenyl-3-methyl-5-hydroxy-6-metoxy-1,4-benzoquinol methylase